MPGAFASRLESKRTSAIAPSDRSKVGISVWDSNSRYLSSLHNIFIIEDLPTPLPKRAKEIISTPRESSEMDKDTALAETNSEKTRDRERVHLYTEIRRIAFSNNERFLIKNWRLLQVSCGTML